MHCLLALPGLLPDAPYGEAFLREISAPKLEQVLSRGKLRKTSSLSFEDWLGNLFGLNNDSSLSFAPISYAAEGEDPDDNYWLRADPIHLQVNRDQLILIANETFEITKKESVELISALNKHFLQDGLVFHAPVPSRWYLQQNISTELAFPSLRKVAGKAVDSIMPKDISKKKFRSILNEIQMLLFSHPVNEARENKGQLPINSIWLWGGGKLPKVITPSIASIRSNDHIVMGLSSMSGIHHNPLPINANTWLEELSNKQKNSHHLAVINTLESPMHYSDVNAWQSGLIEIEKNWLTPLVEKLRNATISRLSVIGFNDNDSLEATITKKDLWKFWRQPRSLINVLE